MPTVITTPIKSICCGDISIPETDTILRKRKDPSRLMLYTE